MKHGKVVWQDRAQVGRTFTQPPLFRDKIRYLVLNPTWTVPPGVLAHTVLPAAKENANYIKQRGMRVLTREGKPVKPSSVAWRKYSDVSNFPYILRQDPGPENALGVVKFMFPNPYHVYMHDTPNQLGYGARRRAMSWGCIHVQDPLELAAHLINDPKEWSFEAIKAQVKSGRTETIHLEKPVPLLLLYWTVGAREGHPIEFHPDIYQRDKRILRRLDRPFKLRKKHRRGASH